jgi:hypothetical protein
MKYRTHSLLHPLGCLALFAPFLATAALDYGIMHWSDKLAAQWQADRAAMPVYQLPADYVNAPGSVNLLSHLHDDPRTRNQGDTGTCWLWGCTAVMSINYDVQSGGAQALTNGLSVQFAASNLEMVNTTLQDGGSPGTFQRFYDAVGYALPWTNAPWTDGMGCNKTPSAWIQTQPNIPLSQVTLVQLATFTNDQQQAIATMKSALDAGKALVLELQLANLNDWASFMAYWGKSNLTEEAIIDLAFSAGHPSDDSKGSHLMACVGYNDLDSDPDKHYWIILNSWGTADGLRPNAVFRMAMNTRYDAYYESMMTPVPLFRFSLIEAAFTDKVRKGVASLAVNLQNPNPAANSLQITGVSFPRDLAPTNVYTASLTLNDQGFPCDPATGVWTRDTNGFHYASGPAVVPSLRLDINPATCTWSLTASNLSAGLNRHIDSHYGLYFGLEYAPTSADPARELGGLHAFVYDEMANGGCSQYTNPAPDSPSLSLKLTGTQGVLKIAGETGRTYLVQEAAALNTNWWLRATVPMTQPVEEVVLPAPVTTNRYWRVEVK